MPRVLWDNSGNLFTGDDAMVGVRNPKRWIQLLDYDGSKWYSWVEVQPNYGGKFVQIDGGGHGEITPDVVYPAYNSVDVAVPITTTTIGDDAGTYVEANLAYFDEGQTTLQWVWVFTYCCAAKEVQCIDVIVGWDCVDGIPVITKKRICGQFTITDPPP